MTARVRWSVDGLERSRAALERIVRAEIGAVPGALALVGEEWTTEIRRHAPVRTGTLRRSYAYDVGEQRGGAYVEVATAVSYAPFQEYGTSRQVGTPHVRPATDVMRDRIPRLVAEAMGRAGRGAAPAAGVAGLAATARALTRRRF